MIADDSAGSRLITPIHTVRDAYCRYIVKGYDLEAAIPIAKDYILGALAVILDFGKESGPLNRAFGLAGKYANSIDSFANMKQHLFLSEIPLRLER